MEQTEPKELILHRKNGMMEVWTRVVQNGVVSGRAGDEGDRPFKVECLNSVCDNGGQRLCHLSARLCVVSAFKNASPV